ncbi:MAG: PEP-CTERM sorting domain-containing protein [Pirellulales bacterium]|nr:PEP-CTERM sorting domain-containing protein [Pirellulales bacterium]
MKARRFQFASLFVVAMLVAVVSVRSASALTIDLSLELANVWTPSFSAILSPQPDVSSTFPGPVGLEYNVSISASGLAAGEAAFGGVGFDVELGPGLTAPFGWTPNTDTFPAGPPGPPGDLNKWDENADLGTAGDLVGIVALVAGGVSPPDPRFGFAEPGPSAVGQLFLNWDGAQQSFVNLNIDSVIALNANDNNLLLNVTNAATTNATGGSAVLGIPEPATLMLAGLGLACIGMYRRRS